MSWESSEPVYHLALEWTDAADGTPVAYDDGAGYDYVTATITGRMTPYELSLVEAEWQGDRVFPFLTTGYLLGPTVDMAAGVEVSILDFRVDGPVDSSMTLHDVTIEIHCPLSLPTSGDLSAALNSGVGYHTPRVSTVGNIMESGAFALVDGSKISDRSTRWYSSGLSTDQAAAIVDALRTLRGGTISWGGSSQAAPWGPGQDASASAWIPEWSVHTESNFSWGIELLMVRDSAHPPDILILDGLTGDISGALPTMLIISGGTGSLDPAIQIYTYPWGVL